MIPLRCAHRPVCDNPVFFCLLECSPCKSFEAEADPVLAKENVMKYLIGPVCAIVILSAAHANAATQTFEFNAQVTQVFRGPYASELPFSIDDGSSIHGQFSFESGPLAKVGPQKTGISFTIDGVELQSSTFGIIPVSGYYPPGNNGNLTSSSFEPYGSGLDLSCWSIGTACSPGTVPNSFMSWEFHLSFESATKKLITEYNIPADIDIWNAFDLRGLSFSFFPNGVVFPGSGILVDATVGSLTAVPEPSTYIQAAFVLVSLCVFRNRRCYSHAPDVPAVTACKATRGHGAASDTTHASR
jgi:hypothetical protein